MSTPGLEAYVNLVGLEGFENIKLFQFKRGPMRKAFRSAGRLVAKEAKQKINARSGGFSNYPAKRTGRLLKSLRVRVSKPGMLVKVFHEKRADQQDFYAAYLHYGTSKGLRARDNWIADALADCQGDVRSMLRQGLNEALK